MPKRSFIPIAIVVLIVSLGCSISHALSATGTPTPDLAATQAFQALQTVQAATEAAAHEATVAVQQTAAGEATVAAQATQAYLNGQATQAAIKTMNANRKATRQAATEAALIAETEQAQSLADEIQQLYADKIITTTAGKYYRLDDFDQSWAQINWYQWWRTGLKLKNFVLRTDAAWESASNTANWFSSGCGFVFAENGVDNHYLSFLALDGHVYNYRVLRGVDTELTGGYYGPLKTPDGAAQLMLVVDDHFITFFVNGVRVVRLQDMSLSEGHLGWTLNSGTNLEYGTRCRMTNTEVWVLEE